MTPEQAAKLREPFPASVIRKLPKAGINLAYVDHAAVTDRLLQVDPAWNWEPLAFDDQGLPQLDEKGGLWIRLTVCGVTRLGYGEPQGSDFYDRRKGAISNAIRVASMRFGVALDLWSKEELATSQPIEHPKPVASEDQLVEWTAAICTAPSFVHLKAISDDITGYHLPEEPAEELRAIWKGRYEELKADSDAD
jgi:hypothetical protein